MVAMKESTEEKLISAGKFGILVVQLNGYLPLSVENGKLAIKYFSAPFLLQCLSNLLFVLDLIFIVSNPDEYSQRSSSFTHTENVILNWLGVISSTVCLYFHIHGIWIRNSTLYFWKGTVELLKSFEVMPLPDLEKKLAQVSSSVRKSFFLLMITISGFVGLMFAMPLTENAAIEDIGLGSSILELIAGTWFNVFILIRVGNVIWLCFFLKLYIAFFHLVELKLRQLCEIFGKNQVISVWPTHISESKLQRISVDWIESEIKLCYKLYMRLDKQVQEFSVHFQDQLVSESFLGILNLVAYTLIFIRIGVNSHLELATSVTCLAPVLIFAKHLYDLGTEGSQLSTAASSVLDSIHDFYRLAGGSLPFYLRHLLQMFAIKMNNRLPTVDAGQYFTFNRKFITTILSTVTTYLMILIQFRTAEIQMSRSKNETA